MKISKIEKLDVSNGEGCGVSIFLQGCHFHCKGCFNPETWDFGSGEDFTADTLKTILELLNRPYIKRLSILGGEPLAVENLVMTQTLIEAVKMYLPHIKIWIYTGYTVNDNLLSMSPESDDIEMDVYRWYIASHADYIVDGQYLEQEKDLTLPFRGSRNQRIINVDKSFKQGSIALYEA